MKFDSPLAKAGIAFLLFALAALLAIPAVGDAVSGGASGDPKIRMVILVISMLGVVFFAGSLGATPHRAVVDAYNRASLQQALTFAWFVLLSGSFLALSLYNTMLWKAGQNTVEFFVDIPQTVWILAGITLGGLAGDAAIKTALAERAGPVPTETDNPNRAGDMFRNAVPQQAKPSDMIANARYGSQTTTDLGAVQQLMFQVVLLIGYAIAVFRFAMTSDGTKAFAALPNIPEQLLYLIFGSTLGGLVTKANGGRPANPQANAETPPTEAVFEEATPEAATAAVQSYRSARPLRAPSPGGGGASTAATAEASMADPEAIELSIKAASYARDAQTAADEIYSAPAFHLGNGSAFRFILWVVLMMRSPDIGSRQAIEIARDHIDEHSSATSNLRSMYLANLAVAERIGKPSDASRKGTPRDQVLAEVVDGRATILVAGILTPSDGFLQLPGR